MRIHIAQLCFDTIQAIIESVDSISRDGPDVTYVTLHEKTKHNALAVNLRYKPK